MGSGIRREGLDMDDRRVVVTGGTGFLGSRLARKLVSLGCDVHLLVRSPLLPKGLQTVIPTDRIHMISEDQSALNSILVAVRPALVIHLSTAWRIPPGEDATNVFIRANVLFPSMLLEAMEQAQVRDLINAASFWQYFDNQLYSPVNLYAATKQAFETIAQYYAEARHFRVLHLVIGDTYGEDDPRPKLIPALQKNQSMALSPGNQVVEFLHVDDVVRGFCVGMRYLAEQKISIERYALRPDTAIRLKELVALIEEISGKKMQVEWSGKAYREREMMQPVNLWPTLPGWQARISLREGMRRLFSPNLVDNHVND